MSGTPKTYQALAIASALRIYARTKMKVNRDYTPTAMLRNASYITGTIYKRGQYLIAADDLEKWASKK